MYPPKDERDVTTSTTGISDESTAVVDEKLSLWMLPPEPHRSHLQREINDIADSHCLPTFAPHMTILGGIERPHHLDPTEWAELALRGLRDRFAKEASRGGVGPIPCRFGRGGGTSKRPVCVFEKEGGEGRIKWNQCCVSVMERNDEFRRAVELAHSVFASLEEPSEGCCNGDEKDDGEEEDGKGNNFDWTTTLKPPLCNPHYSHAYGLSEPIFGCRVLYNGALSDPIPPTRDGNGNGDSDEDHQQQLAVDVPDDFDAVEAVLVWTHPSNIEGVKKWREVGPPFRLCWNNDEPTALPTEALQVPQVLDSASGWPS